MGPFGVGIIVYSLQFKGPKGAHNFDQLPIYIRADFHLGALRDSFRPLHETLNPKRESPTPFKRKRKP